MKRNFNFRAIFVVVALLLALATFASGETITGFFFTGSPTAWVSGGLTETLPQVGAGIGPCFVGDAPESCVMATASDPGLGTWWWMDFASALDHNLSLGMYQNATRFPFEPPNAPGLSFYGDGRGDNQLSGWFNILELTSDGNGRVLSLAVDFIQFDENVFANWNYGSLRINSTIPLNITSPAPEPASYFLLGTALVALACVPRWRPKWLPQRYTK